MSDSDAARALIETAFSVADREWPGVTSFLKQAYGFELSDDATARMEFFLAIVAAAEGQNPRSGLRVMIHDTIRRIDPEFGVSLYQSLRRYECAWDNPKEFSARLPLPPLKFPQELLGIAFVDGAGLVDFPKATRHGAYDVALIVAVGSAILAAAVDVRRMHKPTSEPI